MKHPPDQTPGAGVGIIGAGPAGLTAAYFLIQQQLKPVIYESNKDIGGLAGSVSFWGRSLDIGPHIFLESSQPAAVRFWKEIGGSDLQCLTLSRGMILKGRITAYPPRPMGLLRSIGVMPFCLAAAGMVKAKLQKKSEAQSSGDFFKNYYGNYFRKLVFNPFCEKYMGVPDSNVDTGFATGLTSFVKEAGKTDVQPEKEKLKTLLYPAQGTKLIWSRIAQKVREQGEIHFEKKLVKIITGKNRIEQLCFSDGTQTEAGFFISTLPIPVLLRLLDRCPAEILGELKNITSRHTVLVYLRVAASAFPYQYITVFDHSLEIGRITNFNAWQSDTGKEKETVLCVEYWCGDTDSNYTASNADIIAKAINELCKADIIDKNNVTGAEVLRVPNSHPVLHTEYSKSLMRINTYLSQFENLALAGRHATFKWDGQADNIIAGMQLAEKIKKFIGRA